MKLGFIKEVYREGTNRFYNLFFQHVGIMLTCAILISVFSMSFKLGVGFSHPKFIPETIKVFFNFIALNAAILSTIKNICYKSNRKTLLSELFLTLIICSAIFNIIVNYNDQLNQLVWIFYPTPLMTAILDDAAAIPWAFVVVGINIIISIVLSLRKKTQVKGISKIVHNGLLVYSVLTVSLWFVTHFSYVGSNYIYMANDLKIIDSIVENHLEKGMELPKQFNLKKYDTYEEFKKDTFSVTQAEYVQDKIANPDLKWSKELILLNDWFNKIQDTRLGNNPQKEIQKSDVKDFTNWVFFVLNYSQVRITPDKWIMCDLIFPPKVNSHATMIKHGLFYVKIKEGKLYTYVEFNRTFKEKQQNLIFNVFYALFHVVYWLCLMYLISHHQRKVFKNKKMGEKV
jgi:hypothetical protein